MTPEERDWNDHSTPPDVANDEFADCPEDDAYTWTNEDAQNEAESADWEPEGVPV